MSLHMRLSRNTASCDSPKPARGGKNRHFAKVVIEKPPKTPAWGLVSRVTPVHMAMRNCTGEDGRPFGFGDQVANPKPPRAAVVKSRGGERRGNAGTTMPVGTAERGERKQTASEASTAD
jgi:hypothetical protein